MLPAGETRRLEFKRVSGKMVGKALETVCAFANTQGGTLVLGMADLKELQGTARLFGVEEIHRDYRLNRDIFVRIFDDRVEVESPGLLPGAITPATIARAGSKARNPLIAVNLREFPDPPNIDAGEGVPMMFAEMAQAELYPPQYRQTTDAAIESVTVTLFNLKLPSAWDEVSDRIDREGSIANADVVRIAGVDTLKASKLLIGWREQGLLVALPGRAKRNMAYTKPSAAEQPITLLSPLEDNNDAGG